MDGNNTNNRSGIFVLALIAASGVAFWIYTLWNTIPQIGPQPQVLKTVDALYTAIRNQDLPRIQTCEKQLLLYLDEGTLPKKPCQHLMGIIAQAKNEEWQIASKSLYRFMLDQQRLPL